MADGFRIGAWSMLLLVLATQLALLAAALAAAPRNRRANRTLAAALVAIVGLLTPFVIGYAGAYDEWPWLSFAPFAIPLALGPCLYAYVTAIAEGRAIARRHWIAPIVQFAIQAAVFPWPVATKTWFDGAVQEPLLDPLGAAGLLLSMGGYAWASARTLRRYAGWLRGRRRDPAPARRLRAPAAVLTLLLATRGAYDLWDRMVARVDYFDLFAYYIALGAAGLWLGLDGWRGAHAALPEMAEPAARDWTADGRRWIARLAAEGWWRDAALDLDGLARRLGTNGTHLSRALNTAEGSFSTILGRLRAEAVAARIDAGDPDDLLALALDTGFGSKASFNRAFRARFGVAPSAYRRSGGAAAATSHLPDAMRRAAG